MVAAALPTPTTTVRPRGRLRQVPGQDGQRVGGGQRRVEHLPERPPRRRISPRLMLPSRLSAGEYGEATSDGPSRDRRTAREPVMPEIDPQTRTELEAAAFRRLVEHLRDRTDVQNIDMMNLAGFCRNCLSNWYRDAAEEQGVPLSDPEAREIIYGMPYKSGRRSTRRKPRPSRRRNSPPPIPATADRRLRPPTGSGCCPPMGAVGAPPA